MQQSDILIKEANKERARLIIKQKRKAKEKDTIKNILSISSLK
jgi:hypothetical protein